MPAALGSLSDMTVPQFLVAVYKREMSPEKVMNEIGVSKER